MVRTRGTKGTSSSNETIEENSAAENALTEVQTSNSVIEKVEESVEDAKVKDKEEVTVEAKIEEYGERYIQEESEKINDVTIDDVTKTGTEANGDGDGTGESEKTSEDDEIIDQCAEWEDDDNSDDSEDNVADEEENVVGEDEISEDEASEDEIEKQDEDEVVKEEDIEEEDEEEVEYSEPEAMEGEGDEENMPGKEIKKEDDKDSKEHDAAETNLSLKKIENSKSSQKSRKNKRAQNQKKVSSGDKPEPSKKKKGKKRVESMGMIFMCSSKTKDDCYKYKVLGLPESKKDVVVKIYSGMRLFLYDVDLKLMYGIYKAAGPGGYNIEPKAFKSQFPSQVRFTVLNDCLPLAEEKFKKVIKDNYFTKTKFDCTLKSEQVKKLCKLFIDSSKGRKQKKLNQGRKGAKPVQKGKALRQRVGYKRRRTSREELPHNERPRKRPKEAIIPAAPLRHPLPAGPSYASARTSDLDAYRRDPYLESHSLYGDRRNPISSHRDPYRDVRYSPTERRDYYREGRSTYIEPRYPYRDDLDYIVRTDPYRDGKDPYPENRGRVYLEPRSYRDDRDPYVRSRDSYRDRQDPYLGRPEPHRDGPYLEPYSSSYQRDSFPGRIELRGSYRRDELVDRRDLPSLSLETRPRIDIGSQDLIDAHRGHLSYAEPLYSADYASRTSLVRKYRL